jgi:hypothetical protein
MGQAASSAITLQMEATYSSETCVDANGSHDGATVSGGQTYSTLP